MDDYFANIRPLTLRGKLVHKYESQNPNRYTSGGRLYQWIEEQAPSGVPWPAMEVVLREIDIAPSGQSTIVGSGSVDASGNYMPYYPWTDAYGLLSQAEAKEPPLLQSFGNLDIDGFRKLLHDVLAVIQPNIIFTPAYPDYIKETNPRSSTVFPTGEVRDQTIGAQDRSDFIDTITMKVVERHPAGLGNNARTAPGGRRQIKPRLREHGRHHRSTRGKLTNIYTWDFDNYVQFDLFTRTNNEAEDFVAWFEDFLLMYTWLFKYAGIVDMHYWRRLEDKEIAKWRSGLSVRSLQYYIKTQKIFEMDVYRIQEISIRLLDTITTLDELAAFRRARQQRDPWQAIKDALSKSP